ncbi:hypothetical protein, partial [Klebsiella pneumoniae]|uniref:hypothetical protein n=1 Tax=Klebsiella pneumoniae TaxID=573 RepID=UPI001C6F7084
YCEEYHTEWSGNSVTKAICQKLDGCTGALMPECAITYSTADMLQDTLPVGVAIFTFIVNQPMLVQLNFLCDIPSNADE